MNLPPGSVTDYIQAIRSHARKIEAFAKFRETICRIARITSQRSCRMYLALAALLLAVPVFAFTSDCWEVRHFRSEMQREARELRREAYEARSEAHRQKMEAMREAARARMDAQREIRRAHAEVRREIERARQEAREEAREFRRSFR
jgi:hypothetical protein